MTATAYPADVDGFYSAVGLELPTRGTKVSVRCFAAPEAHKHGDRNPSAVVERDTGNWRCHTCDVWGGPFDAGLAMGLSRADAMRLVERHGLKKDKPGEPDARPKSYASNGGSSAAQADAKPLPTEEDLARWRDRLLAEDRLLEWLYARRGWLRSTVEGLGLGFDGERIVFPVRDADGALLNVSRYAPGDRRDGPKMLAASGHRRGLFPAPESVEGEPIWVLEGEPDAVSAHELGIPATAVPGVKKWDPSWATRFGGRGVAVCMDCDREGREAAQRIARELAEYATRVKVIDLDPSRNDGYDLTDLLREAGEDRSSARRALLEMALKAPSVDSEHSPCVALSEFMAIERPPLDPYVSTHDGRTVLLAAENVLLGAGPSGLGKSITFAYDLGGRLAANESSDYLGLRVCGGLNVLLLSFEGSDEDTSERAGLVPEDARGRFLIWDRWRGAPLPRADDDGLTRLAAEVGRHQIDVLVIDTGAAFFSGAHDISKGIPEEAFAAIDRVRELSGRRVAVIVIAHTKKADRTGAKVDELEEISGTFQRKVDSAIVLRRDGEDGPRRRLTFAKVRRGPEPRPKIVSLPADADELPRLSLLHDLATGVKAGTSAADIAEWVRQQGSVVSPGEICDRFDISEATLRERKSDLETLGIVRDKCAGRGQPHAYGTEDQWASERGLFDG